MNNISYLERLGFLAPQGKALDLGCGPGKDTRYLISIGYEVDAVDIKADAINNLNELKESKIKTFLADVVDFNIPKDTYDLVIISNVLTFLPKDKIVAVLKSAVEGLKVGGIIYFSLFGKKHAWADRERMVFFDRDEAYSIIDGLGLEKIRVIEDEGWAKNMKDENTWMQSYKVYLKKV